MTNSILIPAYGQQAHGRRDHICEQISRLIASGQLRPGQRLPSVRQLASDVGVASNTVTAAYQQLTDDGLIVAVYRSGYFVAEAASYELTASPEERSARLPGIFERFPLKARPSENSVIERPRNWMAQPYRFVCNQLDPADFPLEDWRRCSFQASGRALTSITTADHHNEDCDEFVAEVRSRLLPRRGITAEADEILIMSGSQQAIYIIAALLGGPTRKAAMENPGYPDARILSRHFAEVAAVPVDEQGLVVTELPRDLTLLYVTPSQQFPSGVAMSPQRREDLLHYAAQNGVVIVEDGYDAEIDLNPRPQIALAGNPGGAQILYTGSLSKVLSPGLRLGYLVGPADFIREARALRGMMIRHPPPLLQVMTASFIRLGHYDAHVGRLRAHYRQRLDTLRAALAKHLPAGRILPGATGSNLMIQVAGADFHRLAPIALHHGIVFDSLKPCYANGDAPRDVIRLGVSAIPNRSVEDGIRVLAQLLEPTPAQRTDA